MTTDLDLAAIETPKRFVAGSDQECWQCNTAPVFRVTTDVTDWTGYSCRRHLAWSCEYATLNVSAGPRCTEVTFLG